jgi:ketopantoate reductase
MKVLVVGAGAVGQVYGRHLHAGGAEVTFLMKPKHAGACRRGFVLYPLGRREKGPVVFRELDVVTSAAEVAGRRFDQVWMCVPSTALRGPWLDELLASIGEAIVVSLTPGLEDRALLEARVPASRIVTGVIALVSYQTPLATEERPQPGVAYWFPPFSASPFDGDDAAVRAIVSTLRRGGCPARRKREAWRMAAMSSAVMMPELVALEASGWSLRALRRGPHMALAAEAAREALNVVARHHGVRPPLMRAFVRTPFLRAMLTVAPHLVPFDLEAYLAYHFTKVGEQTRLLMGSYISRGRELGLGVEALSRLGALLPAPSAHAPVAAGE